MLILRDFPSAPDPAGRFFPQAGEGGGGIIAARAASALLAELATYPKPGLVSPVDSGSHDDMDAGTFRRSVAAITPSLARLAQAGAEHAPLAALRAIGLDAEAAMLASTGGVNTHRGAIFALGLLCAAAGAGADDPAAFVREAWGAALAGERPTGSHGADAMRRFGVGGARGEAAAGFPAAAEVGLPALREGRRLAAISHNAVPPSLARRGQGWGSPRASRTPVGPDDRAFSSLRKQGRTPTPVSSLRGGGEQVEQAARVHAFFALLAHVEDTNLLHRGGPEGLAFARASAAAFLEAGGAAADDWRARGVAVHRAFVARRLSPGGSADLLAVTLFLDAAERG